MKDNTEDFDAASVRALMQDEHGDDSYTHSSFRSTVIAVSYFVERLATYSSTLERTLFVFKCIGYLVTYL